ncbi:MAG: IMPACT family protein [Limisphaerales bacterium]
MPSSPIYVPARTSQQELREKASRFKAFVFPVASVEIAEEKLAALKREYFDATHTCYAWVTGTGKDEKARSSDAGEPKGTAGPPILDAIRGAGVTNVLVTVVRYFGGTKLGTGGLSRAYRQAAAEALALAGKKELLAEVHLRAPIPLADRLLKLSKRFSAEVKEKKFAQDVSVTLLVPVSQREAFLKEAEKITGRTAG